MRPSLSALAGLFFSVTLFGCGASATIPTPPSTPTNAPPPGTSPEMAKAPKNPIGAMGGAMQGGLPGIAPPVPKAPPKK
jgi:hypothetical protein